MKVRAIHWLSLLPFALLGCEKSQVHIHAPGVTIDSSGTQFTASGDGKNSGDPNGEVHIHAPGVSIDATGSHFTASGDLSKIQDATSATGPVSTETRNVAAFRALASDSMVTVVFSKSNTNSVQILAKQSILNNVVTQVTDGTLRLGMNGIFRDPGPVTITVSGPTLDAISSSGASTVSCTGQFPNMLSVTTDGASKVELQGSATKIALSLSGAGSFKAQSLESAEISGTVDGSSQARLGGKITGVDLSVSGAGNVHVDGIDAIACKFSLDGGSEMEASGQTTTLKVAATGAATANLPSLVAQQCEAEADGGSQVHVNAVKSLQANASGGSEIGYTGNPFTLSPTSDSGASIKSDN